MSSKRFSTFVILLLTAVATAFASGEPLKRIDYSNDKKYTELRDAMHHAFNAADSTRFFPAIKAFEDYLLSKNDLHGYYTQRCNEIVFELNRQRVFEAYSLGRQLSVELREKGLDSEMYMAYNMLGHIDRYCGNKVAAKRIFRRVISMMKEQGYWESMPPIYMNIVNISMNDDPEEAKQLLDSARVIALQYSPERVFDIDTRLGISYFNTDDMPMFFEAYKEYRKGVEEGKSSVHGRTMEVYYLAATGQTEEAVKLAKEELGEEGSETISMIYERAGRWQEAYESLKQANESKDSVNNVVLINSMMSIRDQLTLNDLQQKSMRNRTYAMMAGLIMLLLLIGALEYIVISRRKQQKELKVAYEHALESDRMKTAFIRNVSHEVRTPLNIISGFAQVIADPELTPHTAERQHLAKMMQQNTHKITALIDEMLELSLSESTDEAVKEDEVVVNILLRDILQESQTMVNEQVELKFETTLNDSFKLTTNKALLTRIISALLDNAAKNTTEGSITLRSTAVGMQLLLSVEDTGTGIPPEAAEHIFERFYKVDNFKEGLGLGLPLCRSIAERLDGSVALDTHFKGPGARFVITLPIQPEKDL